MRKYSCQIGVVVLILFNSFCSVAQNDIVFKAVVSNSQPLLGDYFQVDFVLFGASSSVFNPPAFAGFEILSGPSKNVNVRINNGKSESSITWSYYLQPRKTGTYIIGAAWTVAQGKRLMSQPQVVEVRAQESNTAQKAIKAEGDVFVMASLSKEKAYIGEQITLDYVLYSAKDLQNIMLVKDSQFDGFYAEELSITSATAQRRTLGKKQYVTKLLKRVALFPQQQGALLLAPISIQVNVLEEEKPGFFGQRRHRQLTLSSNAPTLQVLNLPEAPTDFSGIVGQIKAELLPLSPLKGVTQSAAIFSLELETSSDPNRFIPPKWVLPAGIEVLDIELKSQSKQEIGGRLLSKRNYHVAFVPQTEGTFVIHPSLNYFNVVLGRFDSLQMGPHTLQIQKGTGTKNAQVATGSSAAVISKFSIGPLLKGIEKQEPLQPAIFNVSFWLFFSFPLIGLLGISGFNRYKKRIENLAPAFLRSKHAYREALIKLKGTDELLTSGNTRFYHQTLLSVLLGYLADKKDVSKSNLSHSEARQYLFEMGVKEEMILVFDEIMLQSEQHLFAKIEALPNPLLLQKTQTLLQQIELQLQLKYKKEHVTR